jgi:acyl dehydratase
VTVDLGTVELADVVRYSGASGDRNPIHYDPDFARAAGYDGVFAMGALHGGWLISHAIAHGAAIPDAGPSRVRLRFHGIVPLGVALSARLEHTENGYEASATVGTTVCATAWIEALPEPPAVSAGSHEQLARFPVEEGAARAFAGAVRWPHEIAVGSAVPPTFPTVLSFWLPQPDPIARVGFAPERTLLGELAVELVDGPLRVGEVLDVREYVGEERTRTGSSGELRFVDLVAELSDGTGLRARYRNTFVLTPEPGTAAGAGTARLRGSRDPRTGETYFPERALSVDGTLSELQPVDLAERGVLYSWTSFDGVHFGQIDLADGVRLQVRLGAGPHAIGAEYRLAGDVAKDWWFARA